jgi:hypothetical protein
MATRGTKITGLNNLPNVTGNIIIPVVDPTVTLATPDGQTLQSNVQQLGNYILAQAGNLFPEANVANTVRNNAQPNITSVGTLVSLSVSGNASVGNNLSVSNTTTTSNLVANVITANIINANIVTAELANGTSNVDIPVANGNVVISVNNTANVAVFSSGGMTIKGISDLGNISNVKIYGGSNHYVISTDGNGNLSWSQSAVTGGPNTAVQYNDNGVFGGSAAFTFDENTEVVGIKKIGYVNSGNSYIVPNTLGTSQQVLGIVDQNTQQMGWKTVPVYYVTVDMRDGSSYLSSPDPVLRVYPVGQRDGSFLDLNVTQI